MTLFCREWTGWAIIYDDVPVSFKHDKEALERWEKKPQHVGTAHPCIITLIDEEDKEKGAD